MFRIICDKRYNINAFTCSTHPHNTIMQFLSETGIIGTIFYFVSLLYILKSFSLSISWHSFGDITYGIILSPDIL